MISFGTGMPLDGVFASMHTLNDFINLLWLVMHMAYTLSIAQCTIILYNAMIYLVVTASGMSTHTLNKIIYSSERKISDVSDSRMYYACYNSVSYYIKFC